MSKRWCFECRSWRHAGACARKQSQQDYCRFLAALRPHGAGPDGNVLFLVLTLDHRGRGQGLAAAYQNLWVRWQALQRQLERAFGKFTGYASTVESHADGHPHLNVVIVSGPLATMLRAKPPRARTRMRDGREVVDRLAPPWFRQHATRAGFGYRATLDLARSAEDVAGYVCKYSKGSVSSPTLAGEVVKLSQLPLQAPKRTRRIRSSKGFLPPARVRNPLVTGELVRASAAEISEWQRLDPNWSPPAPSPRPPRDPENELVFAGQLRAAIHRLDPKFAGDAKRYRRRRSQLLESLSRVMWQLNQDVEDLNQTGAPSG